MEASFKKVIYWYETDVIDQQIIWYGIETFANETDNTDQHVIDGEDSAVRFSDPRHLESFFYLQVEGEH